MIDRGIYNYVKRAIAEGKTKEEIGADLSKRFGWNQAQIDETYNAAQSGDLPDIPPVEATHYVRPPAREGVATLVKIIFLILIIVGLTYVVYYIVPTLDFDIVSSEVTAYPALCTNVAGLEAYTPDNATPVTFQVDGVGQAVTEFVYSDYKSAIHRGNVISTETLQNCNVTDRLDWKCVDNGIAIGFMKGAFFDDAQNDPNVCFVSRAQWYRLLYPPFFGSS